MDLDLDGRVAVVTGASRSASTIGAEIVVDGGFVKGI